MPRFTSPSIWWNPTAPKGGKVRPKILVNFGSAHRYTKEEVQEIIGALSKFFGLEESEASILSPDSSLDFGGTYVIFPVWEELAWSEIFTGALRGHRHHQADKEDEDSLLP